jgi:beta-phosphoglucomutase-like phosphatase (HAD superfamily)
LLSCVIVDIDDTVLDTSRRMQAIWREVLGREVPIEIIESMGLRQIFEAYATPHQLERVREHQTRFFRLLLCEEDLGFEFARLDEAIPYAAETINAWARDSHVVYLTGRTENTRNQTLEALRLHGFPSGDSDLFMVSAEDWSSGRAVEARQACCLM